MVEKLLGLGAPSDRNVLGAKVLYIFFWSTGFCLSSRRCLGRHSRIHGSPVSEAKHHPIDGNVLA